MDNNKVLLLNNLINKSYECSSFAEFLKLTILNLYELVMYDSGMFFCSISKDCSFFKPYIGGNIEQYYKKRNFDERSEYSLQKEVSLPGTDTNVYKALDYTNGVVKTSPEPRSEFLSSQDNFNIACIRIVNKGQFLGEIYLHRSKDRPDFDEEDMFILQLLQPHISTVFGIIHTLNAVKLTETDNQMLSRKGMCILDKELNLAGANIVGLEMLKIPTVYGSSILYHVKELCGDMLSGKNANVPLSYQTETYKTRTDEVRIEIYKDSRKTGKSTRFVIVLEVISAEHKLQDYKFKFTKREADIIDGIIQGKSNLQLAQALNLSENTIKTHIKKVYLKAGANNRAELSYILMLNKG